MVNFFKKEFLLGIGVGFIISAALASTFGSTGLTDDQIKAKARGLGMIERQVVSPIKSQDANITGRQQKDITMQEAQNNTKNETENKTENKTENESIVSITITSGMGSEQIADLLKEKGAIQNRQDFLQALTDLRAHTRIQNGTFNVKVGEPPEKIVRMLIGKS